MSSPSDWRSQFPPMPVAALSSLAMPPTAEWDYRNKVILAPMVRVNTLPMRLLARHYGCQMVYSEEIVACKLKKCDRIVNEALGTIEFTPPGDHQFPAFVTYPGEPVALQLGTANPIDALQAANVAARDVRAIDINMGCPKHFSLQGGMGAALLLRPEVVSDILSTLRRNINLPITCKIRLLDSEASTVEILKRAEMAGVSAIGVHARYPSDRPRHQAMTESVAPLNSCVNVPLLYNGDVFSKEDIPVYKSRSGCSSLLVARGAMWNPSIFTPGDSPMQPIFSVVHSYLNYCHLYNQGFPNSKYTFLEMLKVHVGSYPAFQKLIASKDLDLAEELMNELEAEVEEKCPSLLYGPYKPAPVFFEPRPEKHPESIESNQATLEVLQVNGIRSRKQQRAERKKLQKEKRKARKLMNHEGKEEEKTAEQHQDGESDSDSEAENGHGEANNSNTKQ